MHIIAHLSHHSLVCAALVLALFFIVFHGNYVLNRGLAYRSTILGDTKDGRVATGFSVAIREIKIETYIYIYENTKTISVSKYIYIYI